MGDKLKLGLVGAGAIAQTHVQAMPLVSCAEIVGVADIRPEAAKATAEGLRARSFTSHEELDKAFDLDGVIVCTPPRATPRSPFTSFGRESPSCARSHSPSTRRARGSCWKRLRSRAPR